MEVGSCNAGGVLEGVGKASAGGLGTSLAMVWRLSHPGC